MQDRLFRIKGHTPVTASLVHPLDVDDDIARPGTGVLYIEGETELVLSVELGPSYVVVLLSVILLERNVFVALNVLRNEKHMSSSPFDLLS